MRQMYWRRGRAVDTGNKPGPIFLLRTPFKWDALDLRVTVKGGLMAAGREAGGWEVGKLVLSLELPQGIGRADQVVLRPLGISVLGAGCDVHVPGSGVVDLHKVQDLGQAVHLGHVAVTGARAQELVRDLVGDVPDLQRKLADDSGAIVVMNIGEEVTSGLMGVASPDFQLRSQVSDAVHNVLASGGGEIMRTAFCSQHHVPEICPYQH